MYPLLEMIIVWFLAFVYFRAMNFNAGRPWAPTGLSLATELITSTFKATVVVLGLYLPTGASTQPPPPIWTCVAAGFVLSPAIKPPKVSDTESHLRKQWEEFIQSQLPDKVLKLAIFGLAGGVAAVLPGPPFLILGGLAAVAVITRMPYQALQVEASFALYPDLSTDRRHQARKRLSALPKRALIILLVLTSMLWVGLEKHRLNVGDVKGAKGWDLLPILQGSQRR